jgi:Domain of unknown function (DUF4190)
VDEERLRQIEEEERARMEIRERLAAERNPAQSPRPPEAPPVYPPPSDFPPPAQPAFDPRFHAQPVAMAKTNGLSVAALVLGILWIYWIGSILALVFGYVAKGQIDASNGMQSGRGMAIAGIVLGWVGVGFLILLLIFGVSVAGS